MNRLWMLFCAVGCILLTHAQTSLPSDELINGKLVWEAFDSQREVLQKSSAVIYLDEKAHVKSVYGIVVSNDGYILTKASELEGREFLKVRVERELFDDDDVEVVKVDNSWDVALLKVNAEHDFQPANFREGEVTLGHWVISNGSTTRSRRRVRLGVISAETREIQSASSSVILGVSLGKEDEDAPIKILEVVKDSGAEVAGMKVGDVLLRIEGSEIKEVVDVFDALVGKKTEEKIKVEVLRKGKNKEFEVELMDRPDVPMMTRNDEMSGIVSISKRRDGFERVIHHDTPLTKSSVGGPLLGLDGRCIGMNIARASRVATFAIPARELKVLIDEMMP